MPEVAHAGEEHGHAVGVRSRNHLDIADGAAGLLRTFCSIRSKSGRNISQSTVSFSRSNLTAPADHPTR